MVIGHTYLVVIGERNDTGTDTENHTGVNLTMCVHVSCGVHLCLQSLVAVLLLFPLLCLLLGPFLFFCECSFIILLLTVKFEILWRHANHGCLFFLSIEILDSSFADQAIPSKLVRWVGRRLCLLLS